MTPSVPGSGAGTGSAASPASSAATSPPSNSTNSAPSRPPSVLKLRGSVSSAIRATRTKLLPPPPPPPAPPPAAVASRISSRSPSSSSSAARSASKSSSCALASVATIRSLTRSGVTATSWPPSTTLAPVPSAKSSSTRPSAEVMSVSPS